jgi:hypothetical protein
MSVIARLIFALTRPIILHNTQTGELTNSKTRKKGGGVSDKIIMLFRKEEYENSTFFL